MGTELRLTTTPPAQVGGMAAAVKDVAGRPFNMLEKLLLVGIVVAVLIPHQFNSVINLLEIAITLFVLMSPLLVLVVAKHFGFFVMLAVSVFVGHFSGMSGAAEPTATVAFLKICVYLCFIAILALRCRNASNRRFFLKFIVLPLTLIICASVWIDLYTNTRFFGEWQTQLVVDETALDRVEQRIDSDIVDYWDWFNRGSGFAQRPWHVAPWAICGLIAAMTLRAHGDFKSRWFWVTLLFLILTPLLLPHRNALIIIGAAVGTYLLAAKNRELSVRRGQVLTAIFAILAVFLFLQSFLAESRVGANEEINPLTTTAILKLFSSPLTGDVGIDPRVDIFVRDATWLLDRPVHLFFGTGWNIVVVPSTRPHNLYIAIITAGGLWSLALLFIFLHRQFVQHSGTWKNASGIAKAGLISLALAGITDNYLTSRLGVPASFMALWLTLCLIAAPSPVWSLAQEITTIRKNAPAGAPINKAVPPRKGRER